ncbi:class I SAM-dependent methyltransferase [Mycobacterium montefiorense]|uniref:S-adenosyl-L-methionine-dependent methyltransferase n=3 Tax=Mycobacterium montefiorense TaxID=154654 RepID=A0AA37UTT0_9MYCO|nr:class I SAM-dependent methyltransferase [Mycobacterium montefiorense]GBG36935.1 putative S-adenosyl-L-methionine-dependent methyltransferase [Mycobacterium montefiorense]GKU37841.1 putative S-adenosyl-L-methionine-dependent methyltransferase [Mycobacterium montefiorense]GKU46323.1 putative S-adenosyl-L-methionine-dependent methyltransferase [Mycobacterium montefiorense]GKU51093.1 putative S-adenosyl-L-methionine-dependent methyltransferase [Mycobacterium montefiorense]GKU55117.1 putative S-
MTRTEQDTWDLASSVGATATWVAAARAIASKKPDALIDDPFADPLVRAVGVDFFTGVLDGEITDESGGIAADADLEAEFNLQRMVDMMAVRTRYFDDFFTDATAAGVRQAVILAAGLDSRAYRLDWPAGTVVYEVDQPTVVEFKSTTLSNLGAEPTAQRRTVAVDLRDDWLNALRRSGFDETKPTAWSAEGLLMYLPPDAQDRLFDAITTLSAPGSWLATEYHRDGGMPLLERRAKAMANRWGKFGFDIDVSTLVYDGERTPAADYLTAHRWSVSTRTRADMFAEAGLSVPAGDSVQSLQNSIAVTAVRE